MNYPSKDFHGMTVDQAVTGFHMFISEYLLSEDETWCELITGQGPVKSAILEQVKDLDLDYVIKASNLGSMMVMI